MTVRGRAVSEGVSQLSPIDDADVEIGRQPPRDTRQVLEAPHRWIGDGG